MRLSAQGERFIKNHEGLRLEIYLCAAKKPTIGYGHVCSADEQVRFKDGITEAVADELFRKDIKRFEEGVGRLVRVPLTQSQADALISFAFNLGLNALTASTLLKRLNARNYSQAADEFTKWVHVTVNGKLKKVAGLIARRAEERAMFLKKQTSTVVESPKPQPKDQSSLEVTI
jgi:lysozyme